jgi:hypothetical protein
MRSITSPAITSTAITSPTIDDAGRGHVRAVLSQFDCHVPRPSTKTTRDFPFMQLLRKHPLKSTALGCDICVAM